MCIYGHDTIIPQGGDLGLEEATPTTSVSLFYSTSQAVHFHHIVFLYSYDEAIGPKHIPSFRRFPRLNLRQLH